MDNPTPHNRQINGQTKGHNMDIILFDANPGSLFIFKKTEKICSAVHFVTKFFEAKEPMRSAIRDRAIDAVSSSLSFITHEDLSKSISSLSLKLIEIKSLLHTSYLSGLMSEMNLNILKEEIDSLLGLLENKRQTAFSLPEGFFFIGQDKGQPIGHVLNQPTVKPYYSPPSNSPINQTNSERTNKILSLLKNGKVLTIRDFATSIKGCSEKTLQRELLKLVVDGKVLKTGERRWSRYSLK